MSTTAANQARAAALKAARAKDSEHKRRRTLAALEALEATAASITFTAVAKAAGVSTWLVYAEGIREHIDAARRRQAPPQRRPSADALRQAHHDIGQSAHRPRHRPRSNQDAARRAGQTPAAPAPAPRCRDRRTHRAHLTARVGDLEAVNRRLVAERDARAIEADTANRRVAELEDELSAARESLRRVIKSHN